MSLTCLLLSCHNDLTQFKKENITRIEVHSIPFSILLPIEITEEQIKSNSIKTTIEDSTEIRRIYEKILLLNKVKDINFIYTGIYLRADFYNGDKEILKLLFDRNYFKIGSDFYSKDEVLLESLIK